MSYKKKEDVVKHPKKRKYKKVSVKGKKLRKRYDKKKLFKRKPKEIKEGFEQKSFYPSCGTPVEGGFCELCGVKIE